MSYSIHVDRSAVKFLQKLAKVEEVKIVNAIDWLANNSRPAGVKKLKGKFDYWHSSGRLSRYLRNQRQSVSYFDY